MTIDEAIRYYEGEAKKQSELYSLCPLACNGMKDCLSLENGKGIGCVMLATKYRQLVEWLTELKEAKSIIRVCSRMLGFLLECEIEGTSTRHEVETLLKNITEYLSGGSENG